MARTRNNCITNGSSGKTGNLVFTVDGRMRSRPDISRRVWSPLQKMHLERLEEAKRYGRFAISDPELNEFYARKAAGKHGLGAWHMAIKDYYYPPSIDSADFRDSMRKAGKQVLITAYDNFEVNRVIVSFFSPTSEILENGYAIREPDPSRWHYRMMADFEFVPGLSVIIRAMDMAGNITSVNLTWPVDCHNVISFVPAGIQGSGKIRLKSQLRNWNG